MGNMLLNPGLCIDAYNYGVGSKDGTLEFEYGGDELCNGGVAGFGGGGRKVNFAVVGLYGFLENKYGLEWMSRLAFIKTDAEGFDYQLILDMIPLINYICSSSKCPVLQVEWFSGFKGSDPKGITANSRKLFDALGKLPGGTWELLCILPCNGVNCAGSSGVKFVRVTEPLNENYCADIFAKRAVKN